MADSVAFGWLCDQLEAATSMTRLESRGTARLALKAAGLDSRTASQREVQVVVERILPGELASRSIEDGNGVYERLARQLGAAELMDSQPGDTPERVFERLGR